MFWLLWVAGNSARNFLYSNWIRMLYLPTELTRWLSHTSYEIGTEKIALSFFVLSYIRIKIWCCMWILIYLMLKNGHLCNRHFLKTLTKVKVYCPNLQCPNTCDSENICIYRMQTFLLFQIISSLCKTSKIMRNFIWWTVWQYILSYFVSNNFPVRKLSL